MPIRTKRLQARTKRSWQWTRTAQMFVALGWKNWKTNQDWTWHVPGKQGVCHSLRGNFNGDGNDIYIYIFGIINCSGSVKFRIELRQFRLNLQPDSISLVNYTCLTWHQWTESVWNWSHRNHFVASRSALLVPNQLLKEDDHRKKSCQNLMAHQNWPYQRICLQ